MALLLFRFVRKTTENHCHCEAEGRGNLLYRQKQEPSHRRLPRRPVGAPRNDSGDDGFPHKTRKEEGRWPSPIFHL